MKLRRPREPTAKHHTVFIVGAGFSLAANRQFVGEAAQFGKKYPLIGDLATACFGRAIPSAQIEQAFAGAIEKSEREPIDRLVHSIQAADYYVGSQEADAADSPYSCLLDHFPDAQFVSFNYDALLELVLLKRGAWSPCDGFGVVAEVGTSLRGRTTLIGGSTTSVLHVHGTTLLYAVEMDYSTETDDHRTMTWMKPRDEPRFLFDPDALGHCFAPFERAEPGLGYRPPEHRIIAPVPNKARALDAPFVAAIYRRAGELIQSARRIVAVGYRFASCDRESFDVLLTAAAAADVETQIVAPDAADIAGRLAHGRRDLRVRSTPASFETWVHAGFPR
jgi:hypothetical protein